jgi:hypothetical protein
LPGFIASWPGTPGGDWRRHPTLTTHPLSIASSRMVVEAESISELSFLEIMDRLDMVGSIEFGGIALPTEIGAHRTQ